MKAIRVNQYGGPDALSYEDLPLPEPGAGEARVKIAAAGVNFIDVYQRSGQYKGSPPFTLGSEGAGVVDAVGAEVSDLQVGDRVAFAMSPGAYAEYAIVPAWKLVPVPESITLETAAAVMLQGMTAHYLARSTFPIEVGHSVLTDAVIRYTEQDFVAETRRLTEGKGVHVVYDSVGKTTFEGSINSLRPRGYLVLFGQSSGAVPPFDPQILNAKGSLFLTRPSLAHYSADREELLWRANELFDWIAAGELDLRVDRMVPLAEAAAAHRALEGRETAGKVLLIPAEGR
jgi:NADPH:quinone reductase